MTGFRHAEIAIREALDTDADGLIALIGAVFEEYPNCILDVEGEREMPELLRIRSYFDEHHGRFWVATDNDEIVGCIGCAPSRDDGGIELKKFYVAKRVRELGVGRRLYEFVLAEAARARFIDLWSDTRFHTAHAWYERKGYVRGPHTRELHDRSETVEYYFRLTVGAASRRSGLIA